LFTCLFPQLGYQIWIKFGIACVCGLKVVGLEAIIRKMTRFMPPVILRNDLLNLSVTLKIYLEVWTSRDNVAGA